MDYNKRQIVLSVKEPEKHVLWLRPPIKLDPNYQLFVYGAKGWIPLLCKLNNVVPPSGEDNPPYEGGDGDITPELFNMIINYEALNTNSSYYVGGIAQFRKTYYFNNNEFLSDYLFSIPDTRLSIDSANKVMVLRPNYLKRTHFIGKIIHNPRNSSTEFEGDPSINVTGESHNEVLQYYAKFKVIDSLELEHFVVFSLDSVSPTERRFKSNKITFHTTSATNGQLYQIRSAYLIVNVTNNGSVSLDLLYEIDPIKLKVSDDGRLSIISANSIPPSDDIINLSEIPAIIIDQDDEEVQAIKFTLTKVNVLTQTYEYTSPTIHTALTPKIYKLTFIRGNDGMEGFEEVSAE